MGLRSNFRPLMRGLAAAVLAIGLSACGGKAEREAAHFDRGLAFYESGDLEMARLEFKTVRQINPQNVDALYQLGLVDESQGDFQAAFIKFSQAAEMAPTHTDSLLKLSQLHFLSQEWPEARARADQVLAIAPEDPLAHALLGGLLLREGDIGGAEREATAALASDPKNETALSLMIGLRTKQGRGDDAVAVLDDALIAAPDATELHRLAAALYMELGRTADAEAAFKNLIRLLPDDPDARVSLARLYLSIGQTDAAQGVLEAYVETNADQFQPKLMLIDFLANQKGLAPAEAKIAEFSSADPDEAGYKFALAKLYEKYDEPERARQVLAAIVETAQWSPIEIAARISLANLLIAQDDNPQAERLVADILAHDPENAAALTVRASLLLAGGDPDAAIIDLRTALRQDPANSEALYAIAQAYTKNGDPQLANEALVQLSKLRPGDPAIEVDRALITASGGARDRAIDILDAVLASHADFLPAMALKSDMLIRTGNVQEARAIAERMIAAQPDRPQGYVARGRAALLIGSTSEAIPDFEAALRLDPSGDGVLSLLAGAYAARDGDDAAISFLARFLSDRPDSMPAALLMARYQFQAGDPVAAEETLAAATKRTPASAEPDLLLARLYIQSKDYPAARRILEAGSKRLPGEPEIQAVLASTYRTTGDNAKAVALYETLLNSPMKEVAANNLANILIDESAKDPAALARAISLTEGFRSSSNPYYLDTLAWTLFAAGNTTEALVYLNKAIESGASFPDVYYHLGMAHVELGNTALALSNLEAALEKSQDFRGSDEAKTALAALTGAQNGRSGRE